MIRWPLAAILMLASVAAAAAGPAIGTDLSKGQGWTGVTHSKDVVTARQELMAHIEELMKPIDTLTIRPVGNVEEIRTHAEVIGAMLLALPHLFPPTTNLYSAKARIPATLALPAIWKDFDTFYALAGAAAKAANAMAEAKGTAPMRAASLRLRASCDACHALFLRKYMPPKVLESDYRFDFDAALRK
jgi:cytochrome c556